MPRMPGGRRGAASNPGRPRLDRTRQRARSQRPAPAPEGPRPGGHLGRGHLPVDRRSGPSSIRTPEVAGAPAPGHQRLGHRVPARVAPLRRAPPRSRCSTSTTPSPRSTGPPTSGSRPRSCPSRRRRAPPTGTTTSGTRCGRRWTRPAWCSASTSAPSRTTPDRAHRRRTTPAAGGAVLNYVETTYGGQRAVTQLIAAGVFDRHPDLKVHGVRGRRDVGAVHRRPHGRGLPPARRRRCGRSCRKLPSEYLYTKSTRRSSTTARRSRRYTAMGWQNVCGAATTPTSRAPTATPRRRCTSCSTTSTPSRADRIRIGAFAELFPHVPPAPDA